MCDGTRRLPAGSLYPSHNLLDCNVFFNSLFLYIYIQKKHTDPREVRKLRGMGLPGTKLRGASWRATFAWGLRGDCVGTARLQREFVPSVDMAKCVGIETGYIKIKMRGDYKYTSKWVGIA